jgi:hypothetical protein
VDEARWALELHRTSLPPDSSFGFEVVWPEHSTQSVTDVSERQIAVTKTVPAIVLAAGPNSASGANGSQLARSSMF